jgi:hypothetical protein
MLLFAEELTEEEKERTLNLLKDAIDTFEPSQKTAYLEACSKGIVETESYPLCFLRLARYDPWHAASLLLNFWEQRVSLFGRERAFQKLFDLSGDGCLNQQDIEVLKSGFYCDLPNDEYGHSVIAVDRRRLSAEQHGTMWDSQIRTAFYIVMRCARNPVTQTEGLVVIVKFAFEREDPRFLLPLVRLFYGCLPVRIYRLHMLYTIKSFDVFFPIFKLPNDLEKLWDQTYKSRKPPHSRRFHFGRGPEDFFPQLQSFGISINGIPQSLGGTWNYDNFSCHLEMQKSVSIGTKSILCSSSDKAGTLQSLSWDELVNRIAGNLHDESPESPIWDVLLARLKRALFESRAELAVNTTGCMYKAKYGPFLLNRSLILLTYYSFLQMMH